MQCREQTVKWFKEIKNSKSLYAISIRLYGRKFIVINNNKFIWLVKRYLKRKHIYTNQIYHYLKVTIIMLEYETKQLIK